jgi:5-methyltetrahydropteroyltriglutamate--homocysteine methyltransferase
VAPGDLADELVRQYRAFAPYVTRARPKVCVTGPHMLAKRAHNPPDGPYRGDDRALVFDLVEVLNPALKALASAGCPTIQIDEPVWVGYPEEVHDWAVDAFNRLVDGVPARIELHICYGNYQRRRLFTGTYDDLFPAILKAHAQQFLLEFTPNMGDLLQLFRRYGVDRDVAAGVVDVKSDEPETPEQVAERARQVMRVIPSDRLTLSPDCGLKFTPRRLAYAKLCALGAGAALVRAELVGSAEESQLAPSGMPPVVSSGAARAPNPEASLEAAAVAQPPGSALAGKVKA